MNWTVEALTKRTDFRYLELRPASSNLLADAVRSVQFIIGDVEVADVSAQATISIDSTISTTSPTSSSSASLSTTTISLSSTSTSLSTAVLISSNSNSDTISNASSPISTPHSSNLSSSTKTAIAVGSAAGALLLFTIIFFLFRRRRRSAKRKAKTPTSTEVFEKAELGLGVPGIGDDKYKLAVAELEERGGIVIRELGDERTGSDERGELKTKTKARHLNEVHELSCDVKYR